ncbi:hypothetical protein [Paraburkholderia phenoliruptrix]|uniref:Uncharacterized protein n=2 Tax=Paraburkholderia phenoliruptrix TaxID=252970 RepID=A0A6J5KDK1_9BURK|nr:hypothetical protein [Paraburkholderia phenoliruptrix]AFT87309.1 hypothetical protein BUPH_06308 [Paraburkholderia phenoliruptrix BR3459a]MDR6392684.1 hypothetical protein [Paraburkholderia phenoliruptrix]CAB4051990.1 hypothetical protein LMG9964_05674 [Paraburkholderia phenoliruptrix]
MSLDRRSSPLHRLGLALGAAMLLAGAAHAAQTTPPNEPADVCPALKHIVEASDFKQLHAQPAAQLPGVESTEDCRANAHAYDCHWRAHWQADGVVNDPLEEIGADIAACFPNVVHDVNTPTRQHFIVTTAARRVNVSASVQGQNELRLRVTR